MIYDGIKWYKSRGYWINHTYGSLHRYIWIKHNGEIPKGYIVHHKNEDKTDNEINNLECMTRANHNKIHSIGREHTDKTKQKISESHQGEKHPQAKLSVLDVKAIKTWILLGYRQKDIAEVFKISQQAISMINTGKNWSHIEVR